MGQCYVAELFDPFCLLASCLVQLRFPALVIFPEGDIVVVGSHMFCRKVGPLSTPLMQPILYSCPVHLAVPMGGVPTSCRLTRFTVQRSHPSHTTGHSGRAAHPFGVG